MLYLLDANIFITAKNIHYGLDFCPGFWEWLATAECLASVSMVRTELLAQEDELTEWMRDAFPDEKFLQPSKSTLENYTKIAQHVYSLEYLNLEVRRAFLAGADCWLIAEAMVRNGVVVTYETFNENCRRKIKLPNIARDFNVPCAFISDVMRQEGVRLALEK